MKIIKDKYQFVIVSELRMKKINIILLICFVIGIMSWYLVKDKPFMMDEDEGNGAKVDYFARGVYDKVIEKLTMPPTYHYVVGSISKLLSIDTPGGYRLVNFFLLLMGLLPVFYIASNYNTLRTFQFFFCPIMFVFYFLVYTDLFSLFLVLFAFIFLTKKMYYFSSFFGLFAMLVRQDNVIWVFMFFCSYIFLKDRHDKKYFINIIGYLLSLLIFLCYILYRGGLVFGDTVHHPIGFHIGNIFFSLFVFFLLFFPIVIIRYKDIVSYLERKKQYLYGLAIILIFVFISFTNKHLYNHERGFWFNELLYLIDSNMLFRIIFVVSICFVLSYFIILRFKDVSKYLLYPFAVVFLSLSLLIDPRYYFIPFSFFMIFRKEEDRKIELIMLFYYIIISVLFFWILLVTNKF